MRILMLSLATVALLVAAVLFIGWLLPETRECRAETTIAAPPDLVLAVIADVETQSEWRDVGTVTLTENGWFEVTIHGKRIDFVADGKGEPLLSVHCERSLVKSEWPLPWRALVLVKATNGAHRRPSSWGRSGITAPPRGFDECRHGPRV